MIDWLSKPWPWYISGPLIGLMVPLLLLTGNKTFGISSSLRHVCAACMPGKIPFFSYDWKKEKWNLFFVAGVMMGGFIVYFFFPATQPVTIAPELAAEMNANGITDHSGLVPSQLFSWSSLLTLRGSTMMILGGLLVGFGTRYAGGCTSGHSIMGLSNLQWPSLVATICFMAGGFLVSNLIIPILLKL